MHDTWEPYSELRSFKGFKKVENYVKLYVDRHSDDEDDFLEAKENRKTLVQEVTTLERVIDSTQENDEVFRLKI